MSDARRAMAVRGTIVLAGGDIDHYNRAKMREMLKTFKAMHTLAQPGTQAAIRAAKDRVYRATKAARKQTRAAQQRNRAA